MKRAQRAHHSSAVNRNPLLCPPSMLTECGRRRHEHDLRGGDLSYLQTLSRLLGVPEIVLHLQA